MTRRKAQILDLDGTLVDVRTIRHLIQTKGYDAFHMASATCPPNDHVVEAVRKSHDEGLVNLVFTGRMERHRALSIAWLGRHRVPYAHMWMRHEGDYRKDFVVKKQMFDDASQTYDIVHAWDDRPDIIDLWHFLNVPCTVVPGWE